MMRILFVFLLYVLTCSINGEYGEGEDSEEMENIKNITDKALRTRTKLLNGYQLVTRQIVTDINMYESYGSVSVMFYPIMRDVTKARFTFESKDLGTCTPKTIVVNLKNGAYPALNPDGYDFPKKFISSTKREHVHTVELLSSNSRIIYSIENPKPGNWYAVVYLKLKNPKIHTIKPAACKASFYYKGLPSECQTILYTDLQVKREENIELIDCYTGVAIDYDQLPVLFKCMSHDSIKVMRFNMKIAIFTYIADQELYFRVGARTIPTEDSNIIYCVFDPNVNNAPAITFAPHPATWHYIQVGKVEGNASSLPKCESVKFRPSTTDFDELPNITISELVRADKGRFFGFDYSLPSYDKEGAPFLINITSFEVKTLRFKLNKFLDIGGSLVITTGILTNLKYQKEFRVKSQQTADKQYIRAVICLDIGHPSMPLYNGLCKYNDKVNPALFVLNSKYSESVYDKTYIPYPDSGMWYLTLKIFCIDCTTNESTGTYCFPALDSERVSNVLSSKGNVTRVGTSECNAIIMLKVSSMSCVNGECSDHGTCRVKAVGGLVMSFCVCSGGYGGWDCSDGTRVSNLAYKTMCVLLLTLSNLLNLFSIYVAIIRYYYAEATMYACTLFFSTFYHACVAPPDVAYCITKDHVLQFGDFFCGNMSFWMTIIAMSVITVKFKQSLYIVGSVVIAVLLKWNRHSFICFLVPIATGVVILFTSWYIDYKITGKMKYPTTYYLRYMPIGLVLAFLGSICFIYFQTEENYIIVHSIWHMVIASSIVFLLPDMRQDNNGKLFKPSPNTCKFSICKYFRKSRPTGASDLQPER